jgi:hypothetical protein
LGPLFSSSSFPQRKKGVATFFFRSTAYIQ